MAESKKTMTTSTRKAKVRRKNPPHLISGGELDSASVDGRGGVGACSWTNGPSSESAESPGSNRFSSEVSVNSSRLRPNITLRGNCFAPQCGQWASPGSIEESQLGHRMTSSNGLSFTPC